MDAYNKYAAWADGAPEPVDFIDADTILESIKHAANIVFPIIQSGQMPLDFLRRNKVNKATRLLCLKAAVMAAAIEYAMQFLDDEQLGRIEEILN